MKKDMNKIRATELGMHYAKNILDMDDEVKQLKKVIGAGFWKSFSNGFKKGFNKSLDVLHKAKRPIQIGAIALGQPEIAEGVELADDVSQIARGKGKKLSRKERIKKLLNKYKMKKKIKGGMNRRPPPLNLDGIRNGENNNPIAPPVPFPPPVPVAPPVRVRIPKIKMKDDKKKGGKQKKPVSANDKRKRRGMLLKKIMKEKGMKFIQASKYIKENNIKC